jgi:cobalamin biosynthesis protein CobT
MNRFRTHALALFGGALLLALSVSSVFGAKPVEGDANRGQQVSAFVHDLVFGSDDPEEEPTEEDGDEDEDASEDEDADEDAAEEEADEEASDESQPEDNHGACVKLVAIDPARVDGDNENHGGAVSLAARYTCWGLEPPTDEEAVDEVTTTDAGVKPHGKSATAHEHGRGHGHGRGGNH